MYKLTRIRNNERSWAINLITDINIFLTSLTLLIKRAGGESSVSSNGSTLFPDLLLYGDEGRTQILQGWELKLPNIPITDEALISNAEQKARMLGLNSFVLWNFSAGCLYIRNDEDRFVLAKSWSDKTNHILTRQDVDTYRDDWFNVIKEMIIEINEFIIDGKILSSRIEIVVSQNLMASVLSENKSIVADFIKEEAIRNTVMQSWLNVWWEEVKSEYVADEKNVYYAYAKVLLLNWVNRIIFAHLIKKYHIPARKVSEINETTPILVAVRVFEEITNACDFYNIFAPVDYLDCLPNSSWLYLTELNNFLEDNAIESVSQESFQTILETTVQTLKREIRGQFTTPPVLADILSKITVRNWHSNCLEPCCGTGTIAKSIIKNKMALLSTEEAYRTTWASDKFTFPLQIANIGLVDSATMNIPCQLFNKNVFDLYHGMPIDITNPVDGTTISLQLPQIDAIMSNLPFIAFEVVDADEKTNRIKIINEIKENCGITLSQKSDLYAYIIFSLWKSLKENGRIGVIISNSWLATEWGYNFREALLHYFDIQDVIISGNGRWFDNAKVVTTILILQKKELSAPLPDNRLYFSVIKEKLSDLKNDNDKVDGIVNSINLKRTIDGEILGMSDYTIEDIKKLDSLHVSWNALFYNVSWLLKIKDKLCPITDIFDIFRGSKRGKDELFYPDQNHNIEQKYIIKGIKTAKSLSRLIVKPEDEVFCCSESIEEMQKQGNLGALGWIKKFEGLTNSTGLALPDKLYRIDRNKKHEKYWYELNPVYSMADLVSSVNPNERLFIAKPEARSFINQRVVGLNAIDEKVDIDLMFALMNTILTMFYIEAIGFGRGEGVLDISKERFSRMMILNPALLTLEDVKNIKDSFKPLLHRDIMTTKEELVQGDRYNFDMTVMKAFKIEEHYTSIKESLLTMQNARLSVK